MLDLARERSQVISESRCNSAQKGALSTIGGYAKSYILSFMMMQESIVPTLTVLMSTLSHKTMFKRHNLTMEQLQKTFLLRQPLMSVFSSQKKKICFHPTIICIRLNSCVIQNIHLTKTNSGQCMSIFFFQQSGCQSTK